MSIVSFAFPVHNGHRFDEHKLLEQFEKYMNQRVGIVIKDDECFYAFDGLYLRFAHFDSVDEAYNSEFDFIIFDDGGISSNATRVVGYVRVDSVFNVIDENIMPLFRPCVSGILRPSVDSELPRDDSPESLYIVGCAHRDGTHGFEANKSRSAFYFALASEKGHEGAKQALHSLF
jgi:hypothetical protein